MQSQGTAPKAVRLGALSLFISAACFMGWNALSALAGNPPQDAEGVAAWIRQSRAAIAFSDECLSFATFFLIPGCIGLATWRLRARGPIMAAVLAGSSMALSIVNLSLMNIALGRLVYPVFGISIGPDALALSLSAYYGALHQADLLWAAAAGLLGYSLYRSGKGVWLLVASIVVCTAELVAAFPWLLPSAFVFALRVPHILWLVALGVLMLNEERLAP